MITHTDVDDSDGPPWTDSHIHAKPIRLFEDAVYQGIREIVFKTKKDCDQFYARARALWHGKAAHFECYLSRTPLSVFAVKDPDLMPATISSEDPRTLQWEVVRPGTIRIEGASHIMIVRHEESHKYGVYLNEQLSGRLLDSLDAAKFRAVRLYNELKELRLCE